MSGLAGYWAFSAPGLDEEQFAAFAHGVAHRGSDELGTRHFPESRLRLAHHRPAALDDSAGGRQPTPDSARRYWIAFDGRIYNRGELREELRGLGHVFVSETDTEVVLAAFSQWGPGCQLHFNGMWALAIWDARDRRLFLLRDRFGIKPLHFRIHAGAVAFASELKAFLALPDVDGALDPDVVMQSIIDVDRAQALPRTLLPNVRRLPPGHAMVVDAAGNSRVWPWWSTLDHLPRPAPDPRDQVKEFRFLLADACRLRLRGEGLLAVEQSGGLDSSAIACMVAEIDRGDARASNPEIARRAFVAGFPQSPYDEREQARLVIEHTGMAAHFEVVDGRRALGCIEQVIFDHESIFRFPRVASWMLYRAMREAGIHASLSGVGADSLLGSDHADIELAMDAAMARLELARYWDLRRTLSRLRGGTYRVERASILGEIRWLARRWLARRGLLARIRAVRRGSRPPDVSTLLTAHVGRHGKDDAIAPDPRIAAMAPAQAKHFTDFCSILPTDLANFDRAAMAHGVEVRMPFMDWRLVTYCFALPETSRNGGGYTKSLLRSATAGLVPDPIRLRTSKVAFVSPLDDWARGPLKPWLLDLCSSRGFLEHAAWNGPMVRSIVEEATTGRAGISPVWPILHAYALERAFSAHAKSRPEPGSGAPV